MQALLYKKLEVLQQNKKICTECQYLITIDPVKYQFFLPSSRDGFYVNKSEARYIGMTEYWIPMILDFNQSYLIKDSLENKKIHSLFLCNLSVFRV